MKAPGHWAGTKHRQERNDGECHFLPPRPVLQVRPTPIPLTPSEQFLPLMSYEIEWGFSLSGNQDWNPESRVEMRPFKWYNVNTKKPLTTDHKEDFPLAAKASPPKTKQINQQLKFYKSLLCFSCVSPQIPFLCWANSTEATQTSLRIPCPRKTHGLLPFVWV